MSKTVSKRKKLWRMWAYDDSDKSITITVGDVTISIDHDDCDHHESEMIAEFLSGLSEQYHQWKASRT